MPINIDGSKGIRQNTTEVTKIPVGTTAQRPANPEAGMIRFNTDRGFVEWYDPITDIWSSVAFDVAAVATGGTVTDIEQDGKKFRVHTFTSSGTFEVTRGGNVDVLVVGGGGAGGVGRDSSSAHGGGGGGAGGLVFEQAKTLSTEAYNIVVGNGGIFSERYNSPAASENDGEDSIFDDITAIGGGAGATRTDGLGREGGSGGGATCCEEIGASALQPNSPSGGFGNKGGDSSTGASNVVEAGGGGAGEPGGDALALGGSYDGGDGLYFGEFFTNNFLQDGFFAGGGGPGCSANLEIEPPGGIGGGGNGGQFANPRTEGHSGTPNTGGGGGGGPSNTSGGNFPSGAGGSGIVIVRYRIG